MGTVNCVDHCATECENALQEHWIIVDEELQPADGRQGMVQVHPMPTLSVPRERNQNSSDMIFPAESRGPLAIQSSRTGIGHITKQYVAPVQQDQTHDSDGPQEEDRLPVQIVIERLGRGGRINLKPAGGSDAQRQPRKQMMTSRSKSSKSSLEQLVAGLLPD
mmetsp:Transcript_10793/g.17765  ORF Transcript_10793/g.17765 Transcript_10793/m.17765 type:complete len:163 (-) Transcript_10793:139-627(-)